MLKTASYFHPLKRHFPGKNKEPRLFFFLLDSLSPLNNATSEATKIVSIAVARSLKLGSFSWKPQAPRCVPPLSTFPPFTSEFKSVSILFPLLVSWEMVCVTQIVLISRFSHCHRPCPIKPLSLSLFLPLSPSLPPSFFLLFCFGRQSLLCSLPGLRLYVEHAGLPLTEMPKVCTIKLSDGFFLRKL